MAEINAIKLPNNTVLEIRDTNAMPYSGGTFTGAVAFDDSLYGIDANVGSLIVRGSEQIINNLNVGGRVTANTFIGSLTGTASGNLTSNSSLNAEKLVGLVPSECLPEDMDTTYVLSVGTTNGTILVTPSVGQAYEVNVYGLGSAAYTEANTYATAEQGARADNAVPKTGGTFIGQVNFENELQADGITATNLVVEGSTNIVNNATIGKKLIANEAVFKGVAAHENSVIAEEITTGELVSTGSASIANNVIIGGDVTANSFSGPVSNNILVASNEPEASYVGQLWINSSNDTLKYWNGTAWTSLSL